MTLSNYLGADAKKCRPFAKKIDKAILLAILSIGLLLRIYDLDAESLWLDEIISIKVASHDIYPMFEIFFIHDNTPPLHYILLHGWIKIVGDSEFAARSLSAIFGFLAIPLIYKVAVLIFNKNVGLLSALLLALSEFHIYYSQEARCYSLMVFLTLVSIYFYLKLFKEENSLNSAGYILSTLLLLCTHFFGLFILLAQNLYLVTHFFFSKGGSKANLKRWIALQVLLGVLLSPVLFVLINRLSSLQGDFWIPLPSVRSLVRSFRQYAGSYKLLWLFTPFVIFSVVGFKRVRGNFNIENLFGSIRDYCRQLELNIDWRIYLLFLWLLVPNILPFAISRFSTPIYLARYTIGASLAFYLLLAKGLDNIGNGRFSRLVINLLLVSILLANLWGGYYPKIVKAEWRDVASYVEASAEQGDLVLFNTGANRWVFNYYAHREDLIKKSFPEESVEIYEQDIVELESIIEGFDGVWVILAHTRDSEGLIIKTLDKTCDLLDYKEYKGIEVYHLKSKEADLVSHNCQI